MWNPNSLIIEALLDAGADPNAGTERGDTPLQTAVHSANSRTNPAIVTALLKAGADPNARTERGQTPLHEAAWMNNMDPEIFEALLDAGADPNARNERGQTPLDIALGTVDNPAVLKMLGSATRH